MQIVRALRWAGVISAALIGGMVSTHPKDVESNAAAWLDLLGFSSWGQGFTATTDDWILGACIVALILSLAFPWFFGTADAVAVKRNPGNGWRVSRLIMRVWTLRRVETLCQDFLAQPHKTDEVRVLAARALRQHRREGGTEKGSWEFWTGLEDAMKRHGSDPVTNAITELDEKFPPSWLLNFWMKHRQRREKKQTREPKTHVLRPAFSGNLTSSGLKVDLQMVPAPAPPWREPRRRLYWIWRKKIRRPIRQCCRQRGK